MKAEEIKTILKDYGADIPSIESRFMGDYNLYELCLGMTFDDANFEKLRQAIQSKDYKVAFEAAHAIKGVIGNMGLVHLYDATCVLVELLRSNTYSKTEEAYAKIVAELERVRILFGK